MNHAKTYEEEWYVKTPCTADDGGGGTVIILTNALVCVSCGKVAEIRMSYVWDETKRPDLVELGIGASIKHYYTTCDFCNDYTVS